MALNHLPQAERLLSGTITNAGVNASQTSFTVSTPPTKFPTWLEFEPDDATQYEVMRVIGASGSTIFVERGVYNGGIGKTHLVNQPYKQKIFSKHWDAILDAVESGYLLEDIASTLVRVDATHFEIRPTGSLAGGDQTAFYTQGRLLRFNTNDAQTAVVGSSTYDGVNNKTVVTVSVGTVPNPLTTVEIAIQPRGATNKYPTTAEVQAAAFQYGEDVVGSDAYAITLSPAISAYTAGLRLAFKAGADNTGPCTLNVNALGTVALKILKDQDPPDGYIKAGQLVEVRHDGTNFQILSISGYPGVERVVTPTAISNTITLDGAIAKEFEYQLPANTMIALANVKPRQKIFIDILQAATGGPYTITWPGGITWVQGVIPTISTGAGKRDMFYLKCISAGVYIGGIVGQNA
jgi:hypothetical protein